MLWFEINKAPNLEAGNFEKRKTVLRYFNPSEFLAVYIYKFASQNKKKEWKEDAFNENAEQKEGLQIKGAKCVSTVRVNDKHGEVLCGQWFM